MGEVNNQKLDCDCWDTAATAAAAAACLCSAVPSINASLTLAGGESRS